MTTFAWEFDRISNCQRINVVGVFDVTITYAEYQGARSKAAYIGLVCRKVAPFLWLAMPCHDVPEPS